MSELNLLIEANDLSHVRMEVSTKKIPKFDHNGVTTYMSSTSVFKDSFIEISQLRFSKPAANRLQYHGRRRYTQ
jgi:hypothetical protein